MAKREKNGFCYELTMLMLVFVFMGGVFYFGAKALGTNDAASVGFFMSASVISFVLSSVCMFEANMQF